MSGPVERYSPRRVTYLGLWEAGPLRMKAYGLEARGHNVSEDVIARARTLLDHDVTSAVRAMGDSNNVGFVIIHPGTLGVSISSYWWVQGSVLCHHMVRQLYSAPQPMETASRPVIGCVWELEIVAAEQAAFKRHMMGPDHDSDGYVASRIAES
ncbi:hypothetical protein [Jannaschia sp. CCS1]|uniref:hypothetical protein n=1 Tax=Jannaschia sp. (strain CCS1) TaxID=290400 RepID=UPI000053B8C0|nr:hypothetical protein [Jannaschia sp. CCS1]ABD56549.1 hypothetical protein Jann_3632 [Jannaschia sp. CCS1]